MLERAKARREKLDTQLSNAGHDLKKRRSPLKDANTILAQAPGLSRNSTNLFFRIELFHHFIRIFQYREKTLKKWCVFDFFLTFQ